MDIAEGRSGALSGVAMTGPRAPWRRMLVPACLLLIVAFFVWSFRSPGTQLDDAYISYRYAYNLAAGRGLVFNPGEYVEGYTNLLWTLLVAAGLALGGDAPAIGHWLSVLFGAASLVTTYVYAERLRPGAPLVALLAPLGLLAANSFVCWTTSGLETPLFLWLAVSAALALVMGRRFTASVLCMLATMTRPDGAILAACLLGTDALLAGLVSRQEKVGGMKLGRAGVYAGNVRPSPEAPSIGLSLDANNHGFGGLGGSGWRVRHTAEGTSPPTFLRLRSTTLAHAAGPCLLFACGLALLTAFRLWYYGDALPNTFYAKVGGIPLSRGLTYLRNFLVDGPGLLIPGAILAAIRLPRFRPAFVFVAVDAVYVVAIGGDVFPVGRFMLPALPMMLAGAVAGGALAWRQNRVSGALLLALVPACMAWGLYGTWPPRWGGPDYDFTRQQPAAFPHSAKRVAARIHWIFSPDEDAQKHVQLARLRALNPPPHLLALVGIGKLGYWGSEFTILDMVGLTDRHIARSGKVLAGTFIAPGHSRTDSVYVLARRPDVIELPKRGSPFLPLPVVIDMWNNPDLERFYHYVPTINAYVRN